MEKKWVNLKELERRAYRSTFNDGIYDIQFGVLFLVFALIPVLESIGISRFAGYGLLLLTLPIPWLGKRFITIPRMGEVEFAEGRTKKKRFALIAGAVMLFLTLPVLFLIAADGVSGGLGWKLIAIFVAPLFVLAVYTTDFPRLYLYAALLLAAVVQAEFLLPLIGTPLNAVYCFGLPGVIITVVGVGILIRFIKEHRRPEAVYAD